MSEKVAESVAEAANIMAETGNPIVTLKNGDTVEIYKCKTKHVGVVMGFLSFVMAEMKITNFGDMPTDVDFTDPQMVLPLLAKASGRVAFICSELCSLSAEQVDDLEIDDTINLIMQQFNLNKDFFLKSVLPLIQVKETPDNTR